MSNEIRVSHNLYIRMNGLEYQSKPNGYQASVVTTTPNGPCPGAINVTTAGVDVDLSQLSTPGMCFIANYDTANFVEYGIREPSTGKFFPLGELGPGEQQIIRLSRNIQEDYYNTGTGTTGQINKLHFKANTAACKVLVAAFER